MSLSMQMIAHSTVMKSLDRMALVILLTDMLSQTALLTYLAVCFKFTLC